VPREGEITQHRGDPHPECLLQPITSFASNSVTSGAADDPGSVIPKVDQDILLLANKVHINRWVDIHDPASVQKELQLFVGHFEDVSVV
jgi:hypothetical protein